MKKSQKNIANIFTNSQCKDNDFKVQLVKVYNAFKDKPMTMLEADYYTGIMRSNICWHIEYLKEQGIIALIQKRKCSVTGFEAGEYTTNPNLFPKPNQAQLKFDFY
jgi:hypothetical protein